MLNRWTHLAIVLAAATSLTAAEGNRRQPSQDNGRGDNGRNLAARETDTVRAYRRASPAVVNLHGEKYVRDARSTAARSVSGMGTAVIIDPRGYAITNAHVVDGVRGLRATLADGSEASARLIASRADNDLAVVKIDAGQKLPTIVRGHSDDLMVGEKVVAIGNAFGYVHTTTEGIISALHREIPVDETLEYHDLIQISAGINPGNSGGPLLNVLGEMIGVNVAVREESQQIAFAIPIDQVIETVIDMLIERNESRLMTGVVTASDRRSRGVTVRAVAARSSGDRHGVRAGDRVVRIGSTAINDRLDLALALIDHPSGSPIKWGVVRDGRNHEIAAKPTAAANLNPEALAWQVIGIATRPLDAASLKRITQQTRTPYTGGLVVTDVRHGSPASRQPLQSGDIVLGLHGWQTPAIDDLAVILNHRDVLSGPAAKIFFIRDGRIYQTRLQLPNRTTARVARR